MAADAPLAADVCTTRHEEERTEYETACPEVRSDKVQQGATGFGMVRHGAARHDGVRRGGTCWVRMCRAMLNTLTHPSPLSRSSPIMTAIA